MRHNHAVRIVVGKDSLVFAAGKLYAYYDYVFFNGDVVKPNSPFCLLTNNQNYLRFLLLNSPKDNLLLKGRKP